MKINIPQKLDNCLSAEPKWKRRVEDLAESLTDILSEGTVFFPEYTEHGLLHVNTVLTLAAELIPGDPLSARDAACLVAAIAIHDLGMFLTPAGLDMLMTNQWDSHRNETLDNYSWADAWERYVSETKRLPQERMLRCFGRMIEVEKTTLVKENMTWDDKLVIGEFLRRNHPRLAQEIARAGFPGSTVQHFLEDAGFEEDERSTIGLIARSHGMSLRQMEDYLGPDGYDSNVPVYYLMAILRMADLLDASGDRAPMIRIRQEDLGSPLSREEWALNRCFKISSSRWYPESRHYTVTANPQTSSEYARVEKWLEHAQRELDLCWAALAEKYPDSALKLSIHRVKCTMHEKRRHREIADRILPREVKVTANPEIVRLMIEPLYGDDPTYGVRELLQNAVDACVERKEWERRHGNPNYKGFVDIRVEGDTFTITDNGMGMNEDILLNYYLSAGSSYRNSDAWKASNAPDGESRVARTGKFGVGFLASFLLGDEIEVHTQHREDRKGYWFKFDQRSMPLDVVREKRSNPYATAEGDNAGTTITIKLNKQGLKLKRRGSWRKWYAFDAPHVEYRVDGKRLKYIGRSLFREPGRNIGWFDLTQTAYESYQWAPNMDNRSELYCNGTRIEDGFSDNLGGYGLQVRSPHVSLIDKRAVLDVDLARRRLKSAPEAEALCREVFRWHIARLLLLTRWGTERQCRRNLTLGFRLDEALGWERIPFLLSSGGYSLNHKSLISTLSPEGHVVLYYAGLDAKAAIQTAKCFLDRNIPYAMVVEDVCDTRREEGYPEIKYYYTSPGSFTSKLLTNHARMFEGMATRYFVPNFATSVWLSEKAQQGIPEDRAFLGRLRESDAADGICAFQFDGRQSVMPIHRDRFSIEEFPVAVYLDMRQSNFNADSLFAQTFKETLTPSEGYAPDDYWIPFDMVERKKKFKKAFEELKIYMDYLREHTKNKPYSLLRP